MPLLSEEITCKQIMRVITLAFFDKKKHFMCYCWRKQRFYGCCGTDFECHVGVAVVKGGGMNGLGYWALA